MLNLRVKGSKARTEMANPTGQVDVLRSCPELGEGVSRDLVCDGEEIKYPSAAIVDEDDSHRRPHLS